MELDLKKDIKSLSKLRSDPAAILRQTREECRPVVITERGKPTAVIMNVDAYERQQEKIALMEAVLAGEKDLEEGRSKTLDQVYQQTRQWLAKESK